MYRKISAAYAFLIVLFLISACSDQNSFPEFKGPYLGQNPPGMTPEVFVRGLISTDVYDGSICFTRDNTLCFFVQKDKGIQYMEQVNGVWTKPEPAPFAAGLLDWDFALAPDEKTMFISSRRPNVNETDTLKVYRIWKTERNGKNWSEPQLLPPPVNTGQHDCFPSITVDGTLYFFSNRDDGMGKADNWRSLKTDDGYTEVENLGAPVNSEYRDLDAYIDPHERYIIFVSNRPGGVGKTDLYICFKTAGNRWSDPVNMGDGINSDSYEVIPYVTPDLKYFFFTSDRLGNGDVYWVDAGIIETLKPDSLKLE